MQINVFLLLDILPSNKKILTAINNAMIINKKTSKIYKFFEILFVGTVFVKTLFVVSIILSQVITELSIILSKYLPFLEIHIAGFQI